MSEYVGVDFGNSMVKAAVVESPDGPPRTLRLSERDPFLPLALRKSSNGYQAGWSAFAQRRRDGVNTESAMRERWRDSSLTATLGGSPQRVTFLLGEFLASTGARIQHAANDPMGVVVTVPDSWDHENWTLPVAVRNAGWTPEAYVREWVAALSICEPITGKSVILISLGFSGVRATLCRNEGDAWNALRSVGTPSVSGADLRKRIVRDAAESVIQSARRDPREDSEDDQTLHDAVEAALYQLHREPAANISLSLAGRSHSIPITRDSLAGLADDYGLQLKNLLGILSGDNGESAACPLVVWGEMTTILPVKGWLLQGESPGRSLQILSLDAPAAGAARICALTVTGRLNAGTIAAAGVCPQCGNYDSIRKNNSCGKCSENPITLWETLPSAITDARPAPRAVLTLHDSPESSSVNVDVDHFRLGRNPLSEWVFPADRFPTVSNAHAVILRRGAKYVLDDLGSTNGTLVNESRVGREQELKNGDEIRLGQSGPRILFELKPGRSSKAAIER